MTRGDSLKGEILLLTVGDVAEMLRCSTKTVLRMVAAGEFPDPVRLGVQGVRWRKADVEDYVRKLGSG